MSVPISASRSWAAESVRALGAEVVFHGRDFDEAREPRYGM
jgi:threonine dehydratase